LAFSKSFVPIITCENIRYFLPPKELLIRLLPLFVSAVGGIGQQLRPCWSAPSPIANCPDLMTIEAPSDAWSPKV
jgi:hypothetical protein